MDRSRKKLISYLISVAIPVIALVISFFNTPLTDKAYIAVLAGLILIQITFIYSEFGDDLDVLLESAKNRAVIKPVWESKFYQQWISDVTEAERRVEITYFDNKDPVESPDEVKAEYYEDIGDVIERKPDVEFRRMVRAIPQLNDWVEHLLDERDGLANYSLACFPDNEPAEPERPYISVQLIDNDLTYFVAVGEQRETSSPRDMYVESEEMNNQWSKYYKWLWNRSFVILRRGSIQTEELQEYRDHVRSLEEEDES